MKVGRRVFALALATIVLTGRSLANVELPPIKFDLGRDDMTELQIRAEFVRFGGKPPIKYYELARGQAQLVCNELSLAILGVPFETSANGAEVLGCHFKEDKQGRKVVVYTTDSDEPLLGNHVLRHELARLLGWQPPFNKPNSLVAATPSNNVPLPRPRPTPENSLDQAAQCEPSPHQQIPNIVGQPYARGRARLLKAGFQPLLDWNRMQTEYSGAEEWIGSTGYFEVQACAGTGLGQCLSHFVDRSRNLLRVLTEGDDGSRVARVFFVCDEEAALIFEN